MKNTLLLEIETFIAERGITEYAFGFSAIRNGRLVERLRGGGRIWPDTEARIRAYIKHERTSERRAVSA